MVELSKSVIIYQNLFKSLNQYKFISKISFLTLKLRIVNFYQLLFNITFQPFTINIVYDAKNVEKHTDFLTEALDIICKQAEEAAKKGFTYLILSDRIAGKLFAHHFFI